MKTEFRGFERSALVKSYSGETIAEVFTAREAGDQHDTARVFAAAPELLDALQAIIAHEAHLLNPYRVAAARAAIARATKGQK